MSGALVNLETPTAPVVRSSRRLWASIASVAITLLVLVWASASWRARMASAEIRSLAVLPFTDLTPNHEAWFAPAISCEIIDQLGRAPELHVIGRASILRMKGTPPGAAATLAGSITRTGDRFRIALSMTRVADGYHLWNTTFDRPARDPRAAVEELADAIGRRLHVHMTPISARRGVTPPAVYDAYLESRYLFDMANAQSLNRAQQLLEQATAGDANFVPGWSWLSIVREYRVAAGMARPNQLMPASRDAAERAVALDPDSGMAHLALGIVNLQYDWDWAGAKKELDRAAQLLPESPFVLQWAGRWLRSQGRINEAVAETQRALALDPLSPSLWSDAAAQFLALNQPARAIPFAQRALDLNPADPTTRAALANVLWLGGQQDKARQIFEEMRNSGAAAQLPPAQLASLEARMGEPDAAREMLDAAEDLPDDQLLPAVQYAGLAAVLEDWDRVFSWTEEAYGERDLELPYWPTSPLVPKSDPRFDLFLAQMNLPAPETH